MSGKQPDPSTLHPDTRAVLAGRDPARADGAVNPPVHRATTLVIGDTNDLYNTPRQTYALDGMAIHTALRDALRDIEGGAGVELAPSGLNACALALLTAAKAGGEFLVTDSVYQPTRRFCDRFLKRMGMTTVYCDPHIGAGIAALINERTCAIMMESPGSLTFEVQDVPAIVAAARARNVATILDNTWSAGMYFKPFEHGVDLSVQALSKYQAGHADAFMGSVAAGSNDWVARLKNARKELGLFVSPDDAFLVLRGLRTLPVRLQRQSASAMTIAQWLEQRPEVARVLHPALPSSPDHALWRRDFTGASGLFAVELKPTTPERFKAAMESFALFAMGFSWGGYESLAVPASDGIARTAGGFKAEGQIVRLSIGLEHPDDLIADLAQAFTRLQ